MVIKKNKADREMGYRPGAYHEYEKKTPAFGDFWYSIPAEFRFLLRVMEMVVWLPYRAFVICYRFAKRFFGASQ